jgi:hypothetical protein
MLLCIMKSVKGCKFNGGKWDGKSFIPPTSHLLTLSYFRVKANISLDAFEGTVSFGEDMTKEDFMHKVAAVSATTTAG